jgi:hypothetical protein
VTLKIPAKLWLAKGRIANTYVIFYIGYDKYIFYEMHDIGF